MRLAYHYISYIEIPKGEKPKSEKAFEIISRLPLFVLRLFYKWLVPFYNEWDQRAETMMIVGETKHQRRTIGFFYDHDYWSKKWGWYFQDLLDREPHEVWFARDSDVATRA